MERGWTRAQALQEYLHCISRLHSVLLWYSCPNLLQVLKGAGTQLQKSKYRGAEQNGSIRGCPHGARRCQINGLKKSDFSEAEDTPSEDPHLPDVPVPPG